MKKGLRLTDDSDLRKRRDSDEYFREKVFKNFALVACLVLITFVGLLFITRCLTDKVFQYSVLDLVKQNISGIIFTGISIVGIRQYLRK